MTKQAFLLILLLTTFFNGWAQDREEYYWTFTYLKAKPDQEENLRVFIEKNWFAMDSIAVQQGLLVQYQLYENDANEDWSFIVAVAYYSKERYSAIAEAFNKIREAHDTILIDGLGFADLGAVLKSESVIQRKPSR